MLNYSSLVVCRRNLNENGLNHLSRIIYKQFSFSTRLRNHYQTLDVPKDCSAKDIRNAFISLSKKYHPDKNKGDPKAQERFVKISNAYNVLSKPDKRREYDLTLAHGGNPHMYRQPDQSQYYDARRQNAYREAYRENWEESFSGRNSGYGRYSRSPGRNDRLIRMFMVFFGFFFFIQAMTKRFSYDEYYSSRSRLEQQRKMMEARRNDTTERSGQNTETVKE